MKVTKRIIVWGALVTAVAQFGGCPANSLLTDVQQKVNEAKISGTVATPVFSPTGSVLPTGNPTISITDSTPGATIYYTTDGSTPSTKSTQYTAPFSVNGTNGASITIKAFAVSASMIPSTIATAIYTFSATAVALHVSVSPSTSAGSVTGFLPPYPATTYVNSGTPFALAATPSSGWGFENWSLTAGSATFGNASAANTTVTLSADAAIQANFAQYVLTVNSGGNGTATPSGTSVVGYGIATAIAATPATGYQLVNWTVTSGSSVTFTSTGSSTSTASSDTVKLTGGNATIQANFTIIQYTLTVTSGGNGTTSPSPPKVNYGVATPITATSDSNYGFVNWTVPSGSVTFGSTGTGTSTTSSDTVTLKSGDATIQANFGPTVMYNANGATSGVVPSGSAYSIGQTVTVSGNTGNLANSGYTFAGWNTAANGSGTTYSAGNTFSMPASEVTLYAVWNKQVNGGTTITQPPNYAVTINGPTTLHFGSPANFTSTYTGTPSSYAWYIDTSTTAIGTLSSLSITPTVSTYTYGAHVLTLIITDANGLSYAGSLAITVQN